MAMVAQAVPERPMRPPKRVRPVDELEMYDTCRRLIRNLGARACVTDASVLKDLLSLRDLIDEQAARAARMLHDGTPGLPGLSWGVIGSEFGMTRQAARQRWSQ